MISGAANTVHLRVASLPDFLVMKAHAIGGREKPKDVYDLCYCLDEFPNAIEVVAVDWKARQDDSLVAGAVAILKEKFQSVDHFGPQQLATFHSGGSPDESEMHARRAYELVQKLLNLL
jgi:predicted nucleotidyltransferase component of viral defense system